MGSGLASLALAAAIGVLALVPTRRLFLAGWSSGALTAYFVGLILLGLLVAELRVATRFLVPILIVAYGAPFVTFRAGLASLRERAGRRSPIARPAPVRRVGPTEDAAPESADGTSDAETVRRNAREEQDDADRHRPGG